MLRASLLVIVCMACGVKEIINAANNTQQANQHIFQESIENFTNASEEAPSINETDSLSDAAGNYSDSESEAEYDDQDDAFADIEDKDLLCADYEPVPRSQKLPAALVIGVRKGGTRALLEFFNMNKFVRRAKPEIHFYDRNFHKGLDWYVNQMPPIADGQICMEKTPGYFHSPGVPKRVFDTNNSTKLVLIVRDPVKRLISDYNQFRSNNLDKGRSYPTLEEFIFTKDGNINIGYNPLQRSIYHYHLVRWMRYFPMEHIHIVDGDKFIKEPWVGLQKVERFLDLEPQITENNFFFNATKGFYCGQEFITDRKSEWSCSRKKCLGKSKGRSKPKVAEETYKKLRKFYAPHNDIFYKLTNIEYNWPTD